MSASDSTIVQTFERLRPIEWLRARVRNRRRRRVQRVLELTTVGRYFFVFSILLGLAATNTQNNLLYIVFGMGMGIIIASGILSNMSLSHTRLELLPIPQVQARKPALLPVELHNDKQRFGAWGLFAVLYFERHTGGEIMLPHVGRASSRTAEVPVTFPTRGQYALRSARIVTIYPFGILKKSRIVRPERHVLVWPAIHALRPGRHPFLRKALAAGDRGSSSRNMRHKGASSELLNLRDYHPEDSPKQIHWKASARTQRLVSKEFESENVRRIVLEVPPVTTRVPMNPLRFEREEATIEACASFAAHLLNDHYEVGLRLPDAHLSPAAGRQQLNAILDALAATTLRLHADHDDATHEEAHNVAVIRLPIPLTEEIRSCFAGDPWPKAQPYART